MILVANSARVLSVVLLWAIMVLSGWVLAVHSRGLEQTSVARKRARYIVSMALAHLGAMSLITAETIGTWGQEPHTIRLPFVLLFLALTLSSLIDLLRYQTGRRMQRTRAGDMPLNARAGDASERRA